MTNLVRQNLVLWIFSICLLATIITLASMRVREFEERIHVLEERQLELVKRVKTRDSEISELRLRLSEKENEIDGLYKPKVISGPAQFPIARVLARSQDTVEQLAQRESTIPEVVIALNPWLGKSEELIKGQAIWVPVQPN